MIPIDNVIKMLQDEKQRLYDKYHKYMVEQCQNWINNNPDFKIYAGMGAWSLHYKNKPIDNHELFMPIANLIDEMQLEDIYLGQNIFPRDNYER